MFTVVLFTAMNFSGTISEYTLGSSFTIICAAITFFFTCLGYGKLKPRPHPIHPLKQGESLISEGFVKIYRTICTVFHEYPNVGKFLIFVMLTEGAVSAGNAVSVVYLKVGSEREVTPNARECNTDRDLVCTHPSHALHPTRVHPGRDQDDERGGQYCIFRRHGRLHHRLWHGVVALTPRQPLLLAQWVFGRGKVEGWGNRVP